MTLSSVVSLFLLIVFSNAIRLSAHSLIASASTIRKVFSETYPQHSPSVPGRDTPCVTAGDVLTEARTKPWKSNPTLSPTSAISDSSHKDFLNNISSCPLLSSFKATISSKKRFFYKIITGNISHQKYHIVLKQ